MGIVLEESPGRRFEALDKDECFALLHDASLGRVAVSIGAVPAVFPVNYHFLDGAIYFFTSEGTKLAAATRDAVVAFEIDDFDVQYHHGWSVMAVGAAHELYEPLARQLLPRLPLEAWAPGSRVHLVRVRAEFVSGRRITDASPGPPTHRATR